MKIFRTILPLLFSFALFFSANGDPGDEIPLSQTPMSDKIETAEELRQRFIEMQGNELIPSKNTPPHMSSSSAVGVYGGVKPIKGRSGTEFHFGFDYDDINSDPCVRCELWIDFNQNEIYEDSEKMPMEHTNPEEVFGKTKYHHYELKRIVENDKANTKIRFRFYAFDGQDEATEDSRYVKGAEIDVRPIVAIFPKGSEVSTVPGARVAIAVQALVDFKLVPDMVFAWEDLMPKQNDGFALVEHHEKGSVPYNEMYDIIESTLVFDLPNSLKEGVYELAFDPLRYWQKSRPNKLGFINIEKVKLSVLPYVFEGPFISRSGVALGDQIDYTFALLVGAPHVGKPEFSLDETQFSFASFESEMGVPVTTLYPHGAQKKEYRMKLVYFGLPGSITIPGAKISHLSFPQMPITVFPVNPPLKVPKNNEEYWKIVLDLKANAKLVHPENTQTGTPHHLWYKGASIFIMTSILSWYGWLGASMFKKRKKGEDVEKQLSQKREAYTHARDVFSKETTRRNLVSYLHALRALILATGKVENMPVGFYPNKLENRDLYHAHMYKERLLSKKERIDDETRGALELYASFPDMTKVVESKLLEEYRDLYNRYFMDAPNDLV